jgi:hypothetical protein
MTITPIALAPILGLLSCVRLDRLDTDACRIVAKCSSRAIFGNIIDYCGPGIDRGELRRMAERFAMPSSTWHGREDDQMPEFKRSCQEERAPLQSGPDVIRSCTDSPIDRVADRCRGSIRGISAAWDRHHGPKRASMELVRDHRRLFA